MGGFPGGIAGAATPMIVCLAAGPPGPRGAGVGAGVAMGAAPTGAGAGVGIGAAPTGPSAGMPSIVPLSLAGACGAGADISGAMPTMVFFIDTDGAFGRPEPLDDPAVPAA